MNYFYKNASLASTLIISVLISTHGFSNPSSSTTQTLFVKVDQQGIELKNNAENWSCVRDLKSGLLWEVKTKSGEQNTSNKYYWDINEPEYQCSNRSHCGAHALIAHLNHMNNGKGLCNVNHWRLPDTEELYSIIDIQYRYPALNKSYFPNSLSSRYWTNTPLAPSSQRAWTVNFNVGIVDYRLKTEPNFLRLVHD